MDWTNYLFSFNGRINRAKWWMFLLVCLGYIVGAIVLSFVFGAISLSLAMIWGIIVLVGYLVLYYCALAVSAKRLHDRNKSAWWLLLFYGVPFVLGVYSYSTMFSRMAGMAGTAPNDAGAQQQMLMNMMQTMQGMWWVQLIDLVIIIWIIVELGCMKGTTGDNQYGPDPLANIPH